MERDIMAAADDDAVTKPPAAELSPLEADERSVTGTGTVGDEDNGLDLEDRQVEEMRTIFATSLPQYVDPLEEMVKQVLAGEGGSATVDALQASAGSLREAADKMRFEEVSSILTRLEQAVGLAADTMTRAGTSEDERLEARELALAAILDLRALSEGLGGSAPEASGRPLVEVLAGMPDSGAVVARLARAGLLTDQQILGAPQDEVAAVSGLSLETVGQVVALVTGGDPPRPERPRERDEGDELVAAVSRLEARLGEVQDDIAVREVAIQTLKRDLAGVEEELTTGRKTVQEIERWLAAAGRLRAKLVQQRDLYATALRAAEREQQGRQEVIGQLRRVVRDHEAELSTTREALQELDQMVRGVRTRLGGA